MKEIYFKWYILFVIFITSFFFLHLVNNAHSESFKDNHNNFCNKHVGSTISFQGNSRKVNRKPMMKMLLTGEPIKANYAKKIGLINDCFSKSKLNAEVLKVAKKIASKSNLTIKIGKQAFYKQLEMPLKKAYSYTSKMMTINMMAMDAKEGISAFLDKRKPKWKNK